jgi:hypothetical protein
MVKPFGTRAVPKKPWERDTAVENSSAHVDEPSTPVVDPEFPPMEADDSFESTTDSVGGSGGEEPESERR